MDKDYSIFEDRLTALEESEMQMFRFLLDRPSGVILSSDTDILLARLLDAAGLAYLSSDNIAVVPDGVREAYGAVWGDETELRWRKRNWMYKCIEAGRYLYGVMTWKILGDLFALACPGSDANEVRELFETTPENLQWFSEREGRLVLNGFEKDDYYKFLEKEIQRDVPFYIPAKNEVEELYEQGSLISREAHAELQRFISETFGCSMDIAAMKIHELYEAVNDRVRISDAADAFAAGGAELGLDFSFPSDELQFRFVEKYIEMSRECRIRDNRGHDYYEMVAMMASRGSDATASANGNKTVVKRVKTGRNDPCPCGSGKKYKNCCGSHRNGN